jgi:hypothetical protein
LRSSIRQRGDRAVQLVSETGIPRGDALQETYVDFRLETGRMS